MWYDYIIMNNTFKPQIGTQIPLRRTDRASWSYNSATGEVTTEYRSDKSTDKLSLGKYLMSHPVGMATFEAHKKWLKSEGIGYRIVYRLPIDGKYPSSYMGSSDGGVRKGNALVASIIKA